MKRLVGRAESAAPLRPVALSAWVNSVFRVLLRSGKQLPCVADSIYWWILALFEVESITGLVGGGGQNNSWSLGNLKPRLLRNLKPGLFGFLWNSDMWLLGSHTTRKLTRKVNSALELHHLQVWDEAHSINLPHWGHWGLIQPQDTWAGLRLISILA